MLLLGKPYAEWAKAPWSNTPSSLRERLLDTPDRFYVDVSRKISYIRARLLSGMTPMSGGQWSARKLDDTTNWQSVMEFLFDIIKTFAWLGDPAIQVSMKDNFNCIAKNLETFGSAINAKRQENNIEAKLDMRALWLEYFKSLCNTMVARTHSFFLKGVKSTIGKARAEYNATADEKGDVNCRAEAKRCGEIWSDLERVLHRADSYIMMPLDGYTGFAASPSDSKVVGSLFPLPFRWDQRKEYEHDRPWPLATQHADDPTALYADRSKLLATMDEGNTNHDYVRLLQRGEPKTLECEPWISVIHSRTQWSLNHGGSQDQKWGFVGYMLTHKPSQQGWEVFLSKLNTDFLKSGQGVEGFDTVKGNMDIQWIDGEAAGIPHDDIEAAKR